MGRYSFQIAFKDTSTISRSSADVLGDSLRSNLIHGWPKPRTTDKDSFPLNRQMAIAISLPICFLVLLAVLAVVIYCSRARRSRQQSGPEDGSEAPRNNFVDELDEALAQPGRDYGTTATPEDASHSRTPAALQDSTDVISPCQSSTTAVELGEAHSLEASRDDVSTSHPEDSSHASSSTSPQTIRSVDGSSDEDLVRSHFSGLKDPFSDTAAVESSSGAEGNDSPVSPATHSHRPSSHGQDSSVDAAGHTLSVETILPRGEDVRPEENTDAPDLLGELDHSTTEGESTAPALGSEGGPSNSQTLHRPRSHNLLPPAMDDEATGLTRSRSVPDTERSQGQGEFDL